MSFLKSRSVGNAAEKELVTFLEEYGATDIAFSDKENCKKYDVSCKLKKKDLTFEVKYDVMATRTGNIAIEVHNTKKDEPSGVYSTESEYWIHKLVGKTYIIKTKELIKFIESTKPDRVVEYGGDKNARLYLYKADNILSAFKTLDADNFKTLLKGK